jgi:beta-galactosidase
METEAEVDTVIWSVAAMAIMLVLAGSAFSDEGCARPVLDLDGAWSFRLDPENLGEQKAWFAPTVSFPSPIQVPGAWDAQGFGEETEKLRHNYVGKGWYRRHVTIPAEWQEKQVFVCFGGVYRSAKVWVDGKFAGEHLGYISDFEFDITSFVEAGQESEVVVLVDSEQRWSDDALQGCMDIIDHFFTSWGGIWGHVTVEGRSQAWLQDVFVQPHTAPGGCVVRAAVQGESSRATNIQVTVSDADGGVVVSNTRKIAPGEPISADIELAGAQLWTPETPYLYTARVVLLDSEGATLDHVETRFGVRSIEVRGTDFYVNGVKYYLAGYGDDCVYPDTIAPPADKQFYVDRLRVARSYGFNYVRHHSHFVAPEYYEACDEVGMFVSPELPIAYPRFYDRAHGKALELYKTEWTAAIKRYRNHPSIFDWCMSNELWEGMPRVGEDLYRIAKELDSTRPVIDSDGLFQPGFSDGTKDRSTLDFLTVMFDILTTPLDNPEKFKTGTPLKPMISHETGNYVHFPRFDEIDLFQTTFKPFWLTDARDRVAKAGLIEETPAWSAVSEQLYVQSHKMNIEALRKNPHISGYHWWLLQPWYCGSNGLLDVHRRPIGVAPDEIRCFNGPVVLLQDGITQTYRGGEPLQVTVQISNYSGGAIDNGRVACRLLRDGQEIDTGTLSVDSVPNGTIAMLDAVEFTLPDVSTPRRVTVEATLESERVRQSNHWTAWVYPAGMAKSESAAAVYASPDAMGLLSPLDPEPMPDGPAPASPAVYVARQLTSALLNAAEEGSCVVLLSPAGLFPTDCTTYKPAWWLGVFEGDSNAGTFVYDNPVTRGLTPGGWCDASWFHLLQGAQTMLLDDLPEQPEVFIRALNSHGAPHPFSRYVDFEYTWRNKSLLAQAKVGKGALIVSGLNFDVAARNGGPEAMYMLSRLVEHARTLPAPKAEWPAAFLKDRIDDSLFAKGPLVSGFSRLLNHRGEQGTGQSYRERTATMYRIRQEEPFHLLTWETAPTPDTPYTTFVFAGGFPFTAPLSSLAGFTLAVNGRRVLDFDTTKTQTRWQSEDGSSALLYVPGHVRPSWSETAGLFYLAVPLHLLTPGDACTLEVRPRGSDNKRYFGLNAYADIISGGPGAGTPDQALASSQELCAAVAMEGK